MLFTFENRIGIGKVKIFKIGKNQFKVNRSIPTVYHLLPDIAGEKMF